MPLELGGFCAAVVVKEGSAFLDPLDDLDGEGDGIGTSVQRASLEWQANIRLSGVKPNWKTEFSTMAAGTMAAIPSELLP